MPPKARAVLVGAGGTGSGGSATGGIGAPSVPCQQVFIVDLNQDELVRYDCASEPTRESIAPLAVSTRIIAAFLRAGTHSVYAAAGCRTRDLQRIAESEP